MAKKVRSEVGSRGLKLDERRWASLVLKFDEADDVTSLSSAVRACLSELAPHDAPRVYPHIDTAMRRLLDASGASDIRVVPPDDYVERGDGTRVKLTQAEREILHLVRRGLSNKEIAADLGKSIRTVKTQLTSVYKKMRVRTRARLLARYPQAAPPDEAD